MRTRALHWIAVLGATLAPAAASAQTPPAEPPPAPPPADVQSPPPSTEPLEVRVIGEKADALQKIPGSGELITSKEMKRAQPKDLAEILRRVPGVQTYQSETGGLRMDIGVRGLDATRGRYVLLLEDGVPVAAEPYGAPDLYFAPTVERMRGIEVLKGSGSILFGPATVGGVMNFLTILPPSHRIAGVEADGGTYGYAKVLGMYGDSFGPARFVVQGLHKQSNGFHADDWQVDDYLAKVALDTSERGELTIKLAYHDERAESATAGLSRAMYASDPRRPTLAPNDRAHARQLSLAFIHEYVFDQSTKLRTLAYAYRTSRLYLRQNYTRSPTSGTQYDHFVGTPGIDAIYFQQSTATLDRAFETYGIEPRIEHRFETGNVGHTLSFGARFIYEHGRLPQYASDGVGVSYGETQVDENDKDAALSTYVQDRIAFRDDLLVTPGVRFEHATYHRNLTISPDASGVPRPTDIEGSTAFNDVLPGIGMIFGKPKAHVFAGFHIGYSPPRIATAIGQGNGVDQLLDAEKSYEYEVGTRLAPAKWLKLEGTLFMMNFTNQVVTAGTTGVGVTSEINGGATQHLGAEAAAVFALGDALHLPIGVDLSERYTFSRAHFANGRYKNNLLPYAPLHTSSATLDLYYKQAFGFQATWHHSSSQFTDQQNTVAENVTGTSGELPARDVFDLGARFTEPHTHLTFSVTAKNVFDAVYIQSRRPDGIFPGDFRQVIGGVRWDYEASDPPPAGAN